MSKELRSGISCTGKEATMAMLEIQDDLVELKFLNDIKSSNDNPFWFLDILDTADKKMLNKLSKISVVASNERVQLHAFPIDSLLTQVEKNEHVEWELSNYITNFRRNDYITDLKTMRTNARDQYLDVMAISMEKSFVFGLQTALAKRKLNVGVIGVEYFAAEEALLHSHPEVKNRQCAIAGISKDRIDIGILMNNRLVHYSYNPYQSIPDAILFIRKVFDEFDAASLFVHGEGVTFDWQKNLRKEFGASYMLLNPFRRIRISPMVSQFSRYLGSEYRFASSVGSALWNE
ncbi:MAG: pilus assembly protein PilM [Bacteroidota bacterium]